MILSLIQRLLALVSIAVLAVGGYLVWSWWRLYELADRAYGYEPDTQPWRLWIGGALLLLSILGRTPMLLLLGRSGRPAQTDGAEESLETPDGARLHLTIDGPPNAPALIFVHGWGLDSRMWREERARLSRRFQVVSYDLAGLGRSKPPADRDYSLERLSDHLAAVVRRVGPRKAILVGHSIGGMTVLTFCRRHADLLGRDVAGIVLANTTPHEPTHTTILGEALHAMKPILRPLMWLDIPLQPLVWLMNVQSYLSGQTHLAMRLGGFGTQPTRSDLDLVARQVTRNSPAVQARGNLGMMDWEGAGDLAQIRAPALVFIGGRDVVTVPSAGEAIAWKLKEATAHPLQDAGHLGPIELADEYAAAIESFADQVFTRGARWADTPRRASGEAEVLRLDPEARTAHPLDIPPDPV